MASFRISKTFRGIRPGDRGGRDGLANPERGFRFEIGVGRIPSDPVQVSHVRDQWPFPRYRADGVTISQAYCYLTQVHSSDISGEKLAALQADFDRARREHADILLFEELPGQDALAPLLECAAGGTAVLLGMRAAGKFGTLRTLLRAAPQPQRHWSRLLLAESLRGIASASQVTFRDDALVNAIVENRLDDGARQDG